jgi:hypothetical protein
MEIGIAMSDSAQDFFDAVIAPALDEYREAEGELMQASLSGNAEQLEAARALAFRRARTAVIELHQFTDRVATECPPWGPTLAIAGTRDWLMNNHCSRRRDDMHALQDVADAFKHAKLTRPRKGRPWLVASDKAVVSAAAGFGELGWGEGKWGGAEQTVVEQPDGRKRALSFVLETVEDAWLRAMGRR